MIAVAFLGECRQLNISFTGMMEVGLTNSIVVFCQFTRKSENLAVIQNAAMQGKSLIGNKPFVLIVDNRHKNTLYMSRNYLPSHSIICFFVVLGV